MTKLFKQHGFTLVELLIVISVIGALTAIALSTLNPSAQKGRAADGVRLANVEKIVTGIKAFEAAEGGFPVDTNGDANPLNDANGLDTYMSGWPDNSPAGTSYFYWTNNTTFGVTVEKFDGLTVFKYRSDWSPDVIDICTNKDTSSSLCN